MVGACQTRRNASALSVSRGLPGCNALAPRVLRERGVLVGDAVVSQGIAGPGSRPIGLTTGGLGWRCGKMGLLPCIGACLPCDGF